MFTASIGLALAGSERYAYGKDSETPHCTGLAGLGQDDGLAH
jgi:hypothetical protein